MLMQTCTWTQMLGQQTTKRRSRSEQTGMLALVSNIACLQVHIKKDFLDWLKGDYPHILISLIPAGCTSEFQVADTMINRPLKNHMGKEYKVHAVEVIRQQLAAGVESAKTVVPTKLSVIKPETVGWLLNAHAAIKALGPELIIRGYEKAGTMRAWTDDAYCDSVTESLLSMSPEEAASMKSLTGIDYVQLAELVAQEHTAVPVTATIESDDDDLPLADLVRLQAEQEGIVTIAAAPETDPAVVKAGEVEEEEVQLEGNPYAQLAWLRRMAHAVAPLAVVLKTDRHAMQQQQADKRARSRRAAIEAMYGPDAAAAPATPAAAAPGRTAAAIATEGSLDAAGKAGVDGLLASYADTSEANEMVPITKLQAALLKKGMSASKEALIAYVQWIGANWRSLAASGSLVPDLGYDDLTEAFMFL